MITTMSQSLTLSGLPMAIAAFSRDWDPYGFDDSYDTLEDCADQVLWLLENEPDTLTEALESMAEDSEEPERREAFQLVSLVRARSRASRSRASRSRGSVPRFRKVYTCKCPVWRKEFPRWPQRHS